MSTQKGTTSVVSSGRRKGALIKARSAAVQEQRIETPRADLVVLKIGGHSAKVTIDPTEKAQSVLARFGKLTNRPGIDRKRVFHSTSGKHVYAYSVDPNDTTKVVRENKEGVRTIGRLVNGRFRTLSTARYA
jgi:hypothetical protein